MPSGPMHDHATEIRQLVSSALPLSAIGAWKAVCVPHGVRVAFQKSEHCAIAIDATRAAGFEATLLSTPTEDRAVKFVVTGWDGHTMRARQVELENEVRALRAEINRLRGALVRRPSSHVS